MTSSVKGVAIRNRICSGNLRSSICIRTSFMTMSESAPDVLLPHKKTLHSKRSFGKYPKPLDSPAYDAYVNELHWRIGQTYISVGPIFLDPKRIMTRSRTMLHPLFLFQSGQITVEITQPRLHLTSHRLELSTSLRPVYSQMMGWIPQLMTEISNPARLLVLTDTPHPRLYWLLYIIETRPVRPSRHLLQLSSLLRRHFSPRDLLVLVIQVHPLSSSPSLLYRQVQNPHLCMLYKRNWTLRHWLKRIFARSFKKPSTVNRGENIRLIHHPLAGQYAFMLMVCPIFLNHPPSRQHLITCQVSMTYFTLGASTHEGTQLNV